MKNKLVFLIITTAILAYGSGLLLEALAFGDDSKLFRFATTGNFDSDWVPFFIDGHMAKIENLKSKASFETFNSHHLIEFGELSGTSSSTVPIGSASVAFGVGIVPINVNNELSLQNVVDQCYFHSKDNFSPLCVICEVIDKFGKVVGKGKVESAESYKASTTIPIPITPVPAPSQTTERRANDVQDVTGVKLTVCGPPSEGCSIGFWKNHPEAWKTYKTTDIYSTIFGLGTPYKDLKITVGGVMKPLKMVTLLEALGAQKGGLNNLARQSVAALLNSVALPGTYPYTTAQVLSLTKAAIIAGGSAIDNQATAFDTANNLGGRLCDGTSGGCPRVPTITTTVLANGDVKVVYKQSLDLNDNSYGINAVGWGTMGHSFKDLHNSDNLQFQFVRNSDGIVVLDFLSDYITQNPSNTLTTPAGIIISTPSRYASLGPFGGDGSMIIGSNTWVKEYRTSFADNLNNNGWFVSGVQTPATKAVADLLVNSPPTISSSSYTLPGGSPFGAWDFTNSYTVIISKDAFPGGFSGKYTVKFPSIHNSPEKKCP